MNSVGKIILTAVFANIFIAAYPQNGPETHAFSVQQCIDYSRQHNVQVKNALLDLQVQEQSNKATTAGALPSLSGSIGSTYFFNVPAQTFPNFIGAATYGVLMQEGVKDGNGVPIKAPDDFGYVHAAFGTKWNSNFGLTLNQVLFNGQVFVGLQARKASIDLAQKTIDITRETIATNVYKIYYQLLVSKTQMAQLDANIARAQKLLNDTKALYENGFQEKLDVDRATVQLANLQTQKQSAQTTIDNGYLGLKFLLGMPVKDSLALTDNFNEDELKSNALVDTAYSYSNRNDYQSLILTEKLYNYNIKANKSAYLPTANLTGFFQKTDMANTFDVFQKSAFWSTNSYIGLNISVPIFSGFARDANLRKARLQLQQTQNQIENLKNSIDNDVEQAQNKFKTDVLTMDFQKKNMQLAESVYNQTKKKYESGLASNTDITNAQTDLVAAQTNYISAMYDAVIAKVDYMKAIGRLKY